MYGCAAVFMDEDDVATYTIKAIDDARTLNKTLYLRPQENILSQRELIGVWEKLIGKELDKTYISAQDFLTTLKGIKKKILFSHLSTILLIFFPLIRMSFDFVSAGMDYKLQVGIGHFYHIFYEGCLTDFEIGEDGEEASKLYPDVNYTRMEEYLRIYV